VYKYIKFKEELSQKCLLSVQISDIIIVYTTIKPVQIWTENQISPVIPNLNNFPSSGKIAMFVLKY
jgi:hypothetical protein